MWSALSRSFLRRRIAFPLQLCHYLTFDRDHGEVEQVSQFAGVAAWQAPGSPKPSRRWSLIDQLLGIGAYGSMNHEAQDLFHRMDVLRDRLPEHWYLEFLGVRPDKQRTGLGSTLLTQGTRRCDANGMPAYLETASAGNLAFYEGHGFSKTSQMGALDDVTVWSMWREPRE